MVVWAITLDYAEWVEFDQFIICALLYIVSLLKNLILRLNSSFIIQHSSLLYATT